MAFTAAQIPVDLGRALALRRPVIRVRYEVEEVGRPTLDEILGDR